MLSKGLNNAARQTKGGPAEAGEVAFGRKSAIDHWPSGTNAR